MSRTQPSPNLAATPSNPAQAASSAPTLTRSCTDREESKNDPAADFDREFADCLQNAENVMIAQAERSVREDATERVEEWFRVNATNKSPQEAKNPREKVVDFCHWACLNNDRGLVELYLKLLSSL